MFTKKYAFITRHQPTSEQHALAATEGIELVSVGDMDAFTVCGNDVKALGRFDGVVVVHPASALALSNCYPVAIFENAMRAAEGEKPTFTTVRMHLYPRTDNYANWRSSDGYMPWHAEGAERFEP